MSTVSCDMADMSLTIGDVPPSHRPSGSHYERDRALAAALGEALERYSASFVPESELVFATASELGPEAVAPERFALFREDQYAEKGFPFEPFTSDTPVRWVKGWSIPDGRDAYLPQGLIYMARPRGAEAVLGSPTSKGTALGLTRQEAVVRGLLEVIERDAVMLAWYGRLSLPRLEWSTDSELVERERLHFAPSGLRYEVVDISAFCEVPVAFCVLRAENDDPVRFLVSAAAAPTMREAWDKALRESFQLRPSVKRLRLENPNRSFRADFADIETPSDHALFYVLPENEAHAAFLDGSDQVRDIQDVPSLEGSGPAEWIDAIAQRLEARGASAYAVDVTAPDVREAGLHVVKAISPELQQLDFSHRFRYLGGRRLYEAAYESGLRDAPLSADELNPYPNPFS